jgi:hypothetical protein
MTTTAAAAAFAWSGGLRAFGSDVIRLGVIGCGGRGTGAVSDCLRGTEGVELVAMGDLAPDRLSQAREQLTKLGASTPALASRSAIRIPRSVPRYWKKSTARLMNSRLLLSVQAGSSAAPSQSTSHSSASGGALLTSNNIWTAAMRSSIAV